MATSDLSTSNVIQTLTTSFVEGAGANVSVSDQAWADTFDWRYESNVGAIQSSPMTGIPDIGTWDKSATIAAANMKALAPRTITYTAFAAKFNFDPFTPDEIPNYESDVMWKLGFSTASTISEAAASIKADAFTVNGLSHGNKPLFAVDHEQLASLASTRSNKVSTGFDRAAYLAVRSGMLAWQNYQGQITNLTGAGYTIECHPASEDAVKQAILSPVTSNMGQVNIAASDNVGFCVNPYLDDEGDVIVHNKIAGMKPFIAWERMAPRIFLDTENGGAIRSATVVFGYAFSTKGIPDGAFGISAT